MVPLPRDLSGFSYLVPERLAGRIAPGTRVRVPFRSRTVPAVVWSLDPPAEPAPTRPVTSVSPGTVPAVQRAFVDALARAHLASPGAFPSALESTAASPRSPATAYLTYLAAPDGDSARYTELAGSGPALVVAAGPSAAALPTSGPRWVRGADAAVLETATERSAVLVHREEAPEHRRRVPPFLDTRRAALLRSTHLGTPVVFAARAPRVETLAAVGSGAVRQLADPPPLPRQALQHAPSWNDARATAALLEPIRSGGSAFVWVPAAGYGAAFGCRQCGWTLRCPRCGVTLTVPTAGRARCGSCAELSEPPARCARCGSVELGPRALGAVGVSTALRTLLPGVPVATLSARQPLPPPAFRGVLVGTHAFLDHLPRYGVGAAVVAGVERFLAYPDFRAEERFAQNLTALRWALPRGGRVVLAARTTEAAEAWMRDPRERLAALVSERTAFLYPPAVRLVLLSGRGLPEAPERLPGVRRADTLPGSPRRVLLRVEPAAWDALAPLLRALPRTVVVEPEPDGFGG